MQNLRNPKWLFLVNTLPVVVLLLLFTSQFQIIKSLLSSESIELWEKFGLILLGLSVFSFLYATYLAIKKKETSACYGIISLVVYIAYAYLFYYNVDEILPSSLPRWMFPADMFLYVSAFLMPTLAHSLLLLISHFTRNVQEKKSWKSFVLAISMPIAWYLFSLIIVPLFNIIESNYDFVRKAVNHDFLMHAAIVATISGTLWFVFFLVRAVYILVSKKTELWKRYQLVWKIPVAFILPAIGLLLNNGHFLKYHWSGGGIFGYFGNIWFYVLLVLNAIFICLPNLNNLIYRFALMTARAITLSYSFYFFLVFLPFLPLSLLAIMALGMGFLILAPILLFITHIGELAKDFNYLKAFISKTVLRLTTLVAFLIIPLFVTLSFVGDKKTLNETLSYLYAPNYTKAYHIDAESLKKTIAQIDANKGRNSFLMLSNQTPYISTYYNWLVLDNLTLSDDKINYINNVFFGKEVRSQSNRISGDINNEDVEITSYSTESVFNEQQKAWQTWINLEITNNNLHSWQGEYATRIELPTGCWISDYYLYVGDVKEEGMLVEKKSAMWVFSQIRNEKKDPGILYYLTGNKVAFRVFPFSKDEVRRTGIQFVHKDPVSITIDGIEFNLGNNNKAESNIVETPEMIYIPASKKNSLKKVQRQPYFHFLVDASAKAKGKTEAFISRINGLRKKHPKLWANSKITKVNAYTSTIEVKEDWQSFLKDEQHEGGFFLERAISEGLVKSYLQNSSEYPVIIVVTDSFETSILQKDFSNLAITFPESNIYYNINEEGVLIPHSLIEMPFHPSEATLNDAPEPNFYFPCLEYRTDNNKPYYLSIEEESSIILKSDIVIIDENEIKEKD